MNAYIDQLKTELSRRGEQCGDSSEFSILDFLWYHYSACNPVDDGQIARAETAMAPIHQELSFENSDKLNNYISDLCLAYQRSAFLEGMAIGVHLVRELNI